MMDAFRRISSLVRKEYNQLIRDRSSLVIGIVIPIMLILLIGYGLSLDVKNVPVAVVMEDASPTVQDMLSFMDGSDYFDPRYTTSMKEGAGSGRHNPCAAEFHGKSFQGRQPCADYSLGRGRGFRADGRILS